MSARCSACATDLQHEGAVHACPPGSGHIVCGKEKPLSLDWRPLPLSPPEEERPELTCSAEMDSLVYALRIAALVHGDIGKDESWEEMEGAYQELIARIAQLEADLAAARSALKDSYEKAYDLALLLNVERPSLGGASPHRFNDTDREIL